MGGGRQKESGSGSGHPANPIVALLIREQLLSQEQADYAQRVASRLHVSKPLCEVIRELGYVTEEQIRHAIRSNQGSLRIGDLLNGLGYLADDELERALALQEQGGRQHKLGDILVRNRFLPDDRLTEILALQLDLPVIELATNEPEPGLLGRESVEFFEQFRFVPCDTLPDGAVRVAFADPLDQRSVEAARDIFGANIVVCITRVSQLDEVLARRREEVRLGSEADVTRLDIADLADSIFTAAFRSGASDVHVEPMSNRLRVRFRVDGVMVPFRDYPVRVIPPLVSHFKILCGAEADSVLRRGRAVFALMGVELDLQMSFCATVHGEQIVVRLLMHTGELLPLHELGMLPGMLDRFREEALDAPSGVIMVAGPAGAGKSTTVYSCIERLNRPEVSIITVEDPVAHLVPGIGQCVVSSVAGQSLEDTLGHVLNQDPDIVVIGEARDGLSAAACVQSALTGRKVLTTFHAEDTVGALARLLDMGMEPFLVSSAFSCIMAQRLVRRVCPHCAVPSQPDLSQLRRLGCTYGDLAGAEFRKGRGCSQCRHSGYSGRLAVFEVLIPEAFLRDAVLQRQPTHELRRISMEHAGLVSLLEDGITKAAAGLTTVEEVLRTLPRVHRPRPLADLRRMLGV